VRFADAIFNAVRSLVSVVAHTCLKASYLHDADVCSVTNGGQELCGNADVVEREPAGSKWRTYGSAAGAERLMVPTAGLRHAGRTLAATTDAAEPHQPSAASEGLVAASSARPGQVRADDCFGMHAMTGTLIIARAQQFGELRKCGNA